MAEPLYWWDMETFRGVNLEDSYVLDWRHDSQSRMLVYVLDAFSASHPRPVDAAKRR